MNHILSQIITSSNLSKHAKLSAILRHVFVDIAKIDQTKYFILGSYTIREHREINDLDIMLHYDEFTKLERATKQNIGKIRFCNSQIRWFFDIAKDYNMNKKENFSIEAYQKLSNEGFPNNNFSLSRLMASKDTNIDENGHRYCGLETLLEYKKTINRPKDQDDIKLIEQILKKKMVEFL